MREIEFKMLEALVTGIPVTRAKDAPLEVLHASELVYTYENIFGSIPLRVLVIELPEADNSSVIFQSTPNQ